MAHSLDGKRILMKLSPLFFLLPALIIILSIIAYPLLYGMNLSLYQWRIAEIKSPPLFVAMGNFVELFSNPVFWESVRVTLIFVFTIVVVEVSLGLILALTLNRRMAGIRFFRSIFVLPLMISPVVVGLLWRYMYDANYGWINAIVGVFGMEPQQWLSESHLALLAIIATDIWQWTPFSFLMILAALQGVPADIMEAGVIDGANLVQRILHIQIPYIMSVIAVTAALRMIDAFKGLVVMYNMTFGGPGHATEILSMHLYKTAFVHQQLGKASAIAVVLIIILTFCTLCLQLIPKENH